MPIARTRYWKQRPYDVYRSRSIEVRRPRKGLGDLPSDRDLGLVLGDIEMDDPSSRVIKYNQHRAA
jgi:hypothetical protein